MGYKEWVDEPKHLRNWVRHPIRTYKTWRFVKWIRNEVRQSMLKALDEIIIHGEGEEPKFQGIIYGDWESKFPEVDHMLCSQCSKPWPECGCPNDLWQNLHSKEEMTDGDA